MSLALYSVMVGVVGDMVQAMRGIVAGSSFATAELRLLLQTPVLDMGKRFPRVHLSLYVDDATLERSDRSHLHMVADLTAANDHFVHVLQEDFALEVSSSKSVVLRSAESSAARVQEFGRARVPS